MVNVWDFKIFQQSSNFRTFQSSKFEFSNILPTIKIVKSLITELSNFLHRKYTAKCPSCTPMTSSSRSQTPKTLSSTGSHESSAAHFLWIVAFGILLSHHAKLHVFPVLKRYTRTIYIFKSIFSARIYLLIRLDILHRTDQIFLSTTILHTFTSCR